MDEDQFNDFEQADAPPSSASPSPLDALAFTPSGPSSSAPSPYAHPLPIYSLDSNPTDSNPLDFDEPASGQSFWPHLTKMGSAHASMDPSPLLDFHKNRSESEPKSQPNPTYEFTSFLGEQDDTRNELSVSSGGLGTGNYQAVGADNYRSMGQVDYNFGSEKKEEKPIENLFGSLENTAAVGQLNMNLEMFSWDSPQKEVKVQPVETNSNSNAFGLAAEGIGSNFGMLGQTYENVQTNYSSEIEMDFTTLSYNPLAMETTETKPRTDSEDFEFVEAVPHAVQVKPQEIIAETKGEQNDQPEIWEDFGSTEQTTPIEIVQPSPNIEQSDPVWTETVAETEVATDVRKESDQFEFQSTSPPHASFTQPSSSQPEQPQSQPITQINQAPSAVVPQQQDDDEFGDFEQTAQPAQPEQQQPEPLPTSNQPSIVEIAPQYLQSYESDYYKQKQVELQKLVDSLPDYSYLFQQQFQD